MDAAWQTYHAKACEHLAALEPVGHGDGRMTPILSNETRAQVATTWALLALVEVLKPQQVLEVDIPEAWCGETTEHDMHLWTVSEDIAASPMSPTTSIRRCRGHSDKRLRVGGPPHSRCGECNQTTGNYHLSNCSQNAVDDRLRCFAPGCTDTRDPRWHEHTP